MVVTFYKERAAEDIHLSKISSQHFSEYNKLSFYCDRDKYTVKRLAGVYCTYKNTETKPIRYCDSIKELKAYLNTLDDTKPRWGASR